MQSWGSFWGFSRGRGLENHWNFQPRHIHPARNGKLKDDISFWVFWLNNALNAILMFVSCNVWKHQPKHSCPCSKNGNKLLEMGETFGVWGENTPGSKPSFGFGVKEEERGFSTLFSPANIISSGSCSKLCPFILCGHPHSPSHVHILYLFNNNKFYFLSLQEQN